MDRGPSFPSPPSVSSLSSVNKATVEGQEGEITLGNVADEEEKSLKSEMFLLTARMADPSAEKDELYACLLSLNALQVHKVYSTVQSSVHCTVYCTLHSVLIQCSLRRNDCKLTAITGAAPAKGVPPAKVVPPHSCFGRK